MNKNVTIKVDSELYDDFLMATDLQGAIEEKALEECLEKGMSQYINFAFSKMSQKYSSSGNNFQTLNFSINQNDFYGKANNKIPKWARNPGQLNHKIIKAYFIAEEINDGEEVTLSQLTQLSCELGMTEKQFYSNYHQMKTDGPQTHGKVFEDNGRYVRIWDEVKDTLLQYKECFYN